MKLLKIDESQGFFLDEKGEYVTVDKISKEDLLRLVNRILTEDSELDDYDPGLISNQAHQIIYQSIHSKLSELAERKDEFLDQSDRLYLQDYERYKGDAPQQDAESDALTGAD